MINTDQIKAHRAQRKAAGLVGCIDGVSDLPLYSMRGMTWRPADPKNPHCFCHDCRTTWDPEGSIDLELINEGNEQACFTYASLLPKRKDRLLELMSDSDDALEDFVKAQMDLFAKMDMVKSYQEKLDKLTSSHKIMTVNKSYDFLKHYEAEIDGLESKMRDMMETLKRASEDSDAAEANCRRKGADLSRARSVMREFLETNF
jgi:hypothetical protein